VFIPAKAIRVALYLACLVKLNRSPSPIIQAFYSIKWAHSIFCVDSPTESFVVKTILEGAKRRLSVPKVKKEPIIPELLDFMYDNTCSEIIFTVSVLFVYSQRTICVQSAYYLCLFNCLRWFS